MILSYPHSVFHLHLHLQSWIPWSILIFIHRSFSDPFWTFRCQILNCWSKIVFHLMSCHFTSLILIHFHSFHFNPIHANPTTFNKIEEQEWNEIESKEVKWNRMKSNEIEWNRDRFNHMSSHGTKLNSIKSNEIKWNQIKSNEIKSNQILSYPILSYPLQLHWIESKRLKFRQMKWDEMRWNEMKWNRMGWIGMERNGGDVRWNVWMSGTRGSESVGFNWTHCRVIRYESIWFDMIRYDSIWFNVNRCDSIEIANDFRNSIVISLIWLFMVCSMICTFSKSFWWQGWFDKMRRWMEKESEHLQFCKYVNLWWFQIVKFEELIKYLMIFILWSKLTYMKLIL
jgi:hypothetical protein